VSMFRISIFIGDKCSNEWQSEYDRMYKLLFTLQYKLRLSIFLHTSKKQCIQYSFIYIFFICFIISVLLHTSYNII